MRTRLILSVCLLIIAPFSLNSAEAPSNFGRWRLSLTAGLEFLGENDLNRFTRAEADYIDLYFVNNPECTPLNTQDFTRLSQALSSRLRLHYSLGQRFDLTLGYTQFYANQTHSGPFVFKRDHGWRVLTDTLDYQNLDTRLSLYCPQIGLVYNLPLGRTLKLEMGLSAGPVWASARLNRTIQESITAIENENGSHYTIYEGNRSLIQSGQGSGIGITGNLSLRYPLSRVMGLMLESAYSFYHIPSLSGQSVFETGDSRTEWQGEWFTVGERVVKSWDTTDFYYPSNDPRLLERRSGDFVLNLHSFLSVQLGVYIAL